jgi:excinuclease ABC subunit C
LQYYIKRCLGPCVRDLTNPDIYAEAVRDVQLFLEGRQADLARSLRARMDRAAKDEQYESAAKYRDLISTVEDLMERQRIAASEGDDTDVYGFHYENHMLAVNLFHMRSGRILDRRELFWEDLPEFELMPPSENVDSAQPESRVPAKKSGEFDPGLFFAALLKQVYIDQQYVPRAILVPVDFEEREALEDLLSEKRGSKVEILVPLRGEKRSLIDLAAKNAHQIYDQRFRVMKPSIKMIQEALQDALTLPDLPARIECFDISHIQGAETVASMVVWEDGQMKKSDYRKFIIRTVEGVDDFASMREVVARRYKRVTADKEKLPSLVLIDGGIGQLHAAAEALESLEITNQPLASIAKREEIIYVHGQEDDPVILDRHSPVLHLVQMIRDESHRFAVTFHRKRRQMRDRASELLEIPGIGALTTRRLVEHFGSVRAVKEAEQAALSAVVTPTQATAILDHFRGTGVNTKLAKGNG